MCGGDPNRAARQAQEAEEERRRQIRHATSAIDNVFSGRESQLDDFAEALRGEFRNEALRQKSDADRLLKFSLARGGLTGGSADVDARARLGREFQEGLLRGEKGVQESLGDLMSADEASRQQLIALAQGGASLGSSVQAASRMLQSNLNSARSDSVAQGLGDIFANTRSLFTRQQEAAARRRGLRESEIYADPFSRG